MSEQAVAPHPHPVVGQLAALHHFRTYVDIGVVVVVLALDQPDRAFHDAVGQHRDRARCRGRAAWFWFVRAASAGLSSG